MGKTSKFSKHQTIAAIEQFLKYGESQYGKNHSGYFSGNGWGARCLRAHLKELKEEMEKEKKLDFVNYGK